jgi:hypothetical protein
MNGLPQLLVAGVGVREQTRHIPATRALIRDQSWLSCQRLDADHFVHRSPTS